MDVESGKTKTINTMRKTLYATTISKDELAWVEYLPSGEYHIVRTLV